MEKNDTNINYIDLKEIQTTPWHINNKERSFINYLFGKLNIDLIDQESIIITTDPTYLGYFILESIREFKYFEEK